MRQIRENSRRWLSRPLAGRALAVAGIAVIAWLVWPFFSLIGHGGQVAALLRLAPDLLGLNGPKTYLMLVQNEDELRPTGGYVTAAGTITVHWGRITDLAIEDVFAIDDPRLQYPLAPDPIRDYMDAPYWVLRDSNWSPNFPTAAGVAQAFYTATRPKTIDGVVALDQTLLRIMLEATGPIHVASLPKNVTADNVVDVLRAAREPPDGQSVSYEWWLHRKDSVPAVAMALARRLPWSNWGALLRAGIRALDERHLLVTLSDPADAALLAQQGWDGALEPGTADYLMLVEANIGFNKVNAVEKTRLSYNVDLRQASQPVGSVTLTQYNPVEGQLPCHPGPDYGSGHYSDLIDRCYWSYSRFYVPAGAELQAAIAQNVPGEWMLRGEPVSGTVTTLLGENGTQSFGTLAVVPFGATMTTTVTYRLAPTAVTAGPGQGSFAYNLRLQKQAGTGALPVTLTVQLPAGAVVVAGPAGARRDGDTWRLELALRQNIEVKLVYRLP